MADARVIKFTDGTIEIETPYNRNFVATLKDKVAKNMRRWNPDKQRWIIHPDALPLVRKLLQDHYDFVDDTLG